MKADGTLTDAEIRRAFPVISNTRPYRDVRDLSPSLNVGVGDFVRVVAYNEPTWLDSLNNSPQENAEEHTDEVTRTLTDQGLVVLLHKVTGADMGERDGQTREAYAYDFEVIGFAEPNDGPALMVGAITTGQLWAIVGLLLGSSLLIGTILVAKVEIVGPGKGASMVSSGIFWISLAAIAVSIAVIVKSAKAATP